jgi:hypothetical protein
MALVIRSSSPDPTQLAPSIRHALAQIDKNQPVHSVTSMQRLIMTDLGGVYVLAGLLGAIALVALVLAAAGVYGMVSFSVSERTRELGIRIALGARTDAILWNTVARGSLPTAIGLARRALRGETRASQFRCIDLALRETRTVRHRASIPRV